MRHQPGFHDRIGNIAKRVIEEMRKDVREHHKTAGDAHLAHADAAQPRPSAGEGPRAFGPHVDNRS
jgi:hypothetical protein